MAKLKMIKLQFFPRTTRGTLLPIVSLSLAGVLCVGTLVLYQAFYAYAAAQNYYHTCQRDYCLTGLFNSAANECIRAVQISGNFQKPRQYTSTDFQVSQQKNTPALITIEPHEKTYTITVQREGAQKTGTLFSKNGWHVLMLY